ASEDLQEVPALLNASMARLDTLLTELETQKAAERLVAALDAAAGAAESVEGAVAGVPGLVTQLEGVAAKAENLGIEELLAETTELVTTAERYIGADGAADLPEAFSVALRELAATLTELREGGVVDNANAALASAREAADTVALAAEDLPALIDRMAGVLARAAATLEDYDSGSDLNREARSALREINDAARAFQSLARTIERDPNSLLIGR
ncbi:MAG: paraquat-inducible protein B, partial [Alphaproteobacteria bacterium]|nr:paraquat-inducible protein B [Alphaproteobacteria bacterium]